jgi:hypothetical protein
MKRARSQKLVWTGALCRDLVNHAHRQLGVHHLLDVRALVAWHQTCHEFAREWRDPTETHK